MKHVVLLALLVFFIISHNATNAEEILEVNLVDGTIISGKLVSFDNGFYTINSTTLGTLKIKEKNVRSIRSKNLAAETQPDNSTQTEIQSLQ